MLISTSERNIFCLGELQEVSSLEYGAKTYGGATKFHGKAFSFVEESEFIRVYEGLNSVKIIVPSTIDVNVECDNTSQVAYAKETISNLGGEITNVYDSQGSWYSNECGVVIEKITIIEFDKFNFGFKDFKAMVRLANYIKESMSQEGVSLIINDTLAII